MENDVLCAYAQLFMLVFMLFLHGNLSYFFFIMNQKIKQETDIKICLIFLCNIEFFLYFYVFSNEIIGCPLLSSRMFKS